MKAVQIAQLSFNLSLLKRKLVYHMHVLISLRTCVKSRSKVDTFFLAFYGSVLCLR